MQISFYFFLIKFNLGERGGGGGSNFTFNPLSISTSCFSLNNSETVKAVTLAFCSFQYLFIRDIHAKFGIPNLPQSPDFGQNPGKGISDFWISGQSFVNKNCNKNQSLLTWKLNQLLNLARETWQCQWCHCLFYIFWPICSHPEAGFSMHDL